MPVKLSARYTLDAVAEARDGAVPAIGALSRLTNSAIADAGSKREQWIRPQRSVTDGAAAKRKRKVRRSSDAWRHSRCPTTRPKHDDHREDHCVE